MTKLLLILFSSCAYILAAGLQAYQLFICRRPISQFKPIIFYLYCVALILHAGLLYQWIDLTTGQNLSLANVFSQVLWLSCLLVMISAFRKPTQNLLIVLAPLTTVSILAAATMQTPHVISLNQQPIELIHVFLSLITLSMFGLISIQAIFLAWQDKWLHQKKEFILLSILPPLETMESLMVQMATIGFILLTILIASSILFSLNNAQMHATGAINILIKATFSIVAWIIYAILLTGRLCWGWRGKKMYLLVISGFFMMFLAYFGTKGMQLILNFI